MLNTNLKIKDIIYNKILSTKDRCLYCYRKKHTMVCMQTEYRTLYKCYSKHCFNYRFLQKSDSFEMAYYNGYKDGMFTSHRVKIMKNHIPYYIDHCFESKKSIITIGLDGAKKLSLYLDINKFLTLSASEKINYNYALLDKYLKLRSIL